MTPSGETSDHLLRTLAAVPTSARVLDLQCGDGSSLVALAQLGFDLWACDANPDRVCHGRELLTGIVGQAEALRRVTPAQPSALGYPDEHFDWVVAIGAYDDASNTGELVDMLAETWRVTKRGGWVFAAMRSSRHGLSEETFERLFVEAGFAVAEVPVLERLTIRGIFRRVGPGVTG